MPDREGIDDWVQNDTEKVGKSLGAVRQGGFKPNPAKAIENVLWGMAILSILFMVVSMPWVGPDELIPGTAWLGLSLFGIIGPALLAVLIRVLRFGGAERVDRTVSDRLE